MIIFFLVFVTLILFPIVVTGFRVNGLLLLGVVTMILVRV